VQVAAAAGYAHQFGNHAFRMRDGMQDVTANGQIETLVPRMKFENALVLEPQPGAEARVAGTRQFEMSIDDVDSEHAGPRKKFREPRGDFPCAASCIEDAGLGWERITADEREFLRPNGSRLRVKVSHHGFVGHLLCLRIQIGHRGDILTGVPAIATGVS
jgi:hypothetical protein